MKETELRERAQCAHCEKLIGESKVPMFYTVKIERHMLNLHALRQQTGLAMMLGSASLASVMGPDQDMTMPMMEPGTITICETCANEAIICVAQLAEYVTRQTAKKEVPNVL